MFLKGKNEAHRSKQQKPKSNNHNADEKLTKTNKEAVENKAGSKMRLMVPCGLASD